MPGLIAQMAGFLTKKRYNYATIYVDNASGMGYIYLQKTASADETLEGKRAFERYCATRGVVGVNAHHQNGRAEARIRRLQELSRTMMIHAKRRWPHEISAHLWPYALRMANEAWNATPSLQDPAHRTPEQLFTGTPVATNPQHWQHFGCPCYVLADHRQAQQPIGDKWKARARLGVYLGRSPQHSQSVALVLSITTGLVSPQFHVKLDPNFETVRDYSLLNRPSLWQHRSGLLPAAQPSAPSQAEPTQPEGASPEPEGDRGTPPSPEGATPAEPTAPAPPAPAPAPSPQREKPRQSKSKSTPRRSKRSRKPVTRLLEAMVAEILNQEVPGEIFTFQALYPQDDTHIATPLQAFKATADPDTLYLHEAMREQDWPEFQAAMQLEIDQQLQMKVYSLIKRSEVPKVATILPAVWQLRQKKDVRTGATTWHKARCNIDGSRQIHGEHYDEDPIYPPVAGWTSIQLLLALTLLFDWKTK